MIDRSVPSGTVLTYGTFDMFHFGHLRLLQRAACLGSRLAVGVSTDEFNAAKGKKALISFAHRSAIVRAIDVVDVVIPENDWGQKRNDIREHNVDTLVMGNDWQGEFDHLSTECDVVYLDRTGDISSTQLRSRTSESNLQVDRLRDAVRLLDSVLDELGMVERSEHCDPD